MKVLIAALSTVLLSQWASSEDLDTKTKIIFKDTMQAGTEDLPLSGDSKDKIEAASKNEFGPNGESSKAEISFDCKNWQSLDLEKQKEDTIAKKNAVFRIKDNTLGFLNAKAQTVLLIGKRDASYLRVTDSALIGFSGKKSIVYRPVKGEKIHQGLVGLIQTLVILGAEFTDQWRFRISSAGTPELWFNLSDNKSDDVLRKFLFLHCTVDRNCRLLGKSSENKAVQLEVNSVEHRKLKSIGLFNESRLKVFEKLCNDVTSTEFKTGFETEFKAFKNLCPTNPQVEIPNFSHISNACKEFGKRLLPIIKGLQ